MSEKFKPDIPSHAPTPPEIFFSRRKFMTTVARGILLSPAVFLASGAKDSQAGLLDEPLKRPDVFPAHKPKQMPGAQQAPGYPWPYQEGLRMDEAMHDLTMAVTGVYGKPLLKQHGAPIRIIVPWKYGYKSPKSVVKIELVAEQPKTFWGMQPHEYGFLSNVNPNIPHPRWSQDSSFWLDTGESFPTSIFNRCDKFVGKLYPDEPRTPQIPLHEGQVAR